MNFFSLPPGFGFHPTDVELICHYLKSKILGLKLECAIIPEVDIYKHEPWDLPEKSLIPVRNCTWHFFTSCDRKYPNGTRSNRATEAGYWKSTGKDRNISSQNRLIGTKKTLVFHRGRPPSGVRSDWIMHEYHLNKNECKAAPGMQDAFVLCRVTKKNGLELESEEVGSEKIERTDCADPCFALANINGQKQLEGGSIAVLQNAPSLSPSELEAWLEELSAPNSDSIHPPGKLSSETMGGAKSLATKHDLPVSSALSNLSDYSMISNNPYHLHSELKDSNLYRNLGYQCFSPEFDSEKLLRELQFEVEEVSQVNSDEVREDLSSPDFTVGGNIQGNKGTWNYNSEDGFVDDEEENPNSVGLGLPDNSNGTGVHIRKSNGRRSLNTFPNQRIRLQVHKMEARNVGLVETYTYEDQTVEFVVDGHHLNSKYDSKFDSEQTTASPILDPTRFEIKKEPVPGKLLQASFPDRSVVSEAEESYLPKRSLSKTLLCQYRTETERTPSGKVSSPSNHLYQTAIMTCSEASSRHQRKIMEPSETRHYAGTCHYNGSKWIQALRSISAFSRKCLSVEFNSLFMVTCIMCSAALISYFLQKDVRGFVKGFAAFGS